MIVERTVPQSKSLEKSMFCRVSKNIGELTMNTYKNATLPMLMLFQKFPNI